jgi:hypothetical protein
MSNPYTDTITENFIIREFDSSVDEIEFVWHRDDNDRDVEILKCGDDWMFQYDNELPFYLSEGDYIKIKKDEWHRLHKGSGSLLIKIYNK